VREGCTGSSPARKRYYELDGRTAHSLWRILRICRLSLAICPRKYMLVRVSLAASILRIFWDAATKTFNSCLLSRGRVLAEDFADSMSFTVVDGHGRRSKLGAS
jgi:hypothetical protein